MAPVNWLAAMAQSQFGKGPQKRCKHCSRWAMKNTGGFCRFHRGRHIKRPYLRTQRSIEWELNRTEPRRSKPR